MFQNGISCKRDQMKERFTEGCTKLAAPIGSRRYQAEVDAALPQRRVGSGLYLRLTVWARDWDYSRSMKEFRLPAQIDQADKPINLRCEPRSILNYRGLPLPP